MRSDCRKAVFLLLDATVGWSPLGGRENAIEPFPREITEVGGAAATSGLGGGRFVDRLIGSRVRGLLIGVAGTTVVVPPPSVGWLLGRGPLLGLAVGVFSDAVPGAADAIGAIVRHCLVPDLAVG